MSTAVEQFVIVLGRSSRRASHLLRYLKPEDRDDVIAEAMLACWEHRAHFDPTVRSIDDWFAEKVRDARAALRKRDRTSSIEQLHELASQENTARLAETQQALEKLNAGLTVPERAIVDDLLAGASLREIRQRHGVGNPLTRRVYRKLQGIARGVSQDRDHPHARGLSISRESDEPRAAAPIDHEIEKMLRRPTTERADCPVCWRCMWFDGLKPKNWSPTAYADDEVMQAVERTEREKIRIAGGGP